jgi:O-antigen/teichoic acid export membrane protein
MKFKKSNYLRYFLSLLTGTALAQVITFAISPILTRIYTPEEFGIYGVYLAICSLLLVFTTGRYEFALSSTKGSHETLSLLNVIILISIVFSLLVLVLLILTIFFNKTFEMIWLAVPFTILLMGVNQGLNYTHNKFKNFNTISLSKVVYSIGNSVASIGSGLLNIGIFGLVIANIFALLLSVLNQFKKVHTIAKPLKFKSREKRKNTYSVTNILKKYRHYPLYNVPSAFFEMLAMHAPTFIFMYFFSEAIVGYFNLTLRVINVPITIIIVSLSQVLLSKISDLFLNDRKGIKTTLLRISLILFLIGLLPTILLLLFGEDIFRLFFGNEWTTAGLMASILSLSFFAKFIVSPLSVIFVATQRVKQLSVIQIIRSILLCILLIICAWKFSPIEVVVFYTVFEITFHIIYYLIIINLARQFKTDQSTS